MRSMHRLGGLPDRRSYAILMIGCNGGTPPEENGPAAAAPAASAPSAASKLPWPPPKDLNELFQVEYKTDRVDEIKQYDLAGSARAGSGSSSPSSTAAASPRKP